MQTDFFSFQTELRLAETKFVFLKIYRSKLETTTVTNDDDDVDVVVDDNHGLFIFHRSQTVCASHKRSGQTLSQPGPPFDLIF